MPLSDPPSENSAPSRFAAFSYRDFRLYWTSLFLSNIGSWIQITAVNWLLYQMTGSPLQLGMNGLFRAVPAIGLGLVSGAIADRYDRRRLLIVTQSLLGILAFALGVLDHSESIQPWHIYAITFLSAAVGSCDGPARQALYPSLVPPEVLPSAVALNSVLWKGAVLIGPSLGGLAIQFMGTSGAFYVNAASFLVVVAALVMMRRPKQAMRTRRQFGSELKTGLRYVYSQRVILGIVVMEATSSLFGLDNAMLTIFASDVLQVGAHGFGLLQSARGLGAVLGSGLFITVGQHSAQGKIVVVAAFIYGLCFAFFGLSNSFALSLFLLGCVGAADAIWSAARSTIVQSIAPDRLRGRVMGIFQIANQGLNPLGQVETGLVVPLIGARHATFLGGLIVWLIAMTVNLRVRELPKFRLGEPTQAPRSTRTENTLESS